MIVEFSVKNFRSIKNLQTISFVATELKSSNEYPTVDDNNIFKNENGLRILKTVGIYGANAGGKSNLIKAFDFFVKAIIAQPSSQSNLGLLCDPFLYQLDANNTESFFQIVIIIDNVKFRYGFTVKKNPVAQKPDDTSHSREIITNEWLFGGKDEKLLFERVGQKIEKNNLQNEKILIPDKLPYEHSLYLNHVAAFDSNSYCENIINYLRGRIRMNVSSDTNSLRYFSQNYVDGIFSKDKSKFIEFLSVFNMKYKDLFVQKDHDNPIIDDFPLEKYFLQKEYTVDGQILNVVLNLKNNESGGTQKLFDMAGLFLRTFNLTKPAFIVIDEIDSNFHPSLLIKLISLFNDPEVNKSNSQLLFTSHDTNLMLPSLMRRDQFYFAEKMEDDSTRLYSLADLKGICNDADFAKQYLAGYYGALPVLKNYSNNQE